MNRPWYGDEEQQDDEESEDEQPDEGDANQIEIRTCLGKLQSPFSSSDEHAEKRRR